MIKEFFQIIHDYFYPPEGADMRKCIRYCVIGGAGISAINKGRILR